jgi:hypothetical protein
MKRIIFLTSIAALLLAACAPQMAEAPASYDFADQGVGGGAPMEPAPAVGERSAAQDSFDGDTASGTGNGNAAAIERLVIQNADVGIVVADVEARMQAVAELAEQLGGFVVSSNLYETYTSNYIEVPEATIVIRVPAERLDEALEKIKAGTVEVQNESRSGQDVTADYVDLQSRLKNLEAAETQLVKILEQATETEDVLNVFNQLTSIREQIELVKGQIEYYEEAAALSAISVRIIAQETTQPIQIGPWTPQGAVSDAIQDLVYFWQDFVEFFIYFILNFLPKLILIALVYGLPLWLIVRGLRSLFRKRKAKQAAVVEVKKK